MFHDFLVGFLLGLRRTELKKLHCHVLPGYAWDFEHLGYSTDPTSLQPISPAPTPSGEKVECCTGTWADLAL